MDVQYSVNIKKERALPKRPLVTWMAIIAKLMSFITHLFFIGCGHLLTYSQKSTHIIRPGSSVYICTVFIPFSMYIPDHIDRSLLYLSYINPITLVNKRIQKLFTITMPKYMIVKIMGSGLCAQRYLWKLFLPHYIIMFKILFWIEILEKKWHSVLSRAENYTAYVKSQDIKIAYSHALYSYPFWWILLYIIHNKNYKF